MALLDFVAMSTFAVVIGLIVGNLLQLGGDLEIATPARGRHGRGRRPGVTIHHRVPARHHSRPRSCRHLSGSSSSRPCSWRLSSVRRASAGHGHPCPVLTRPSVCRPPLVVVRDRSPEFVIVPYPADLRGWTTGNHLNSRDVLGSRGPRLNSRRPDHVVSRDIGDSSNPRGSGCSAWAATRRRWQPGGRRPHRLAPARLRRPISATVWGRRGDGAGDLATPRTGRSRSWSCFTPR